MEKYYQILGVDRNASPDEIKQAYYDLVIVWRPDKYLHDPRLHEKAISKLKDIDEAYQKILEYLKPQRCNKKNQSLQNHQNNRRIRTRWMSVLQNIQALIPIKQP